MLQNETMPVVFLYTGRVLWELLWKEMYNPTILMLKSLSPFLRKQIL